MGRKFKSMCVFCEKSIWKLKRHLKTCKVRSQSINPHEDQPLEPSAAEMRLKREVKALQSRIGELEDTVQKMRNSIGCKCFQSEDNLMTIEEAVKVAIIKESTRADYASTAKQYSAFCSERSLNEFSATTVSHFLTHVKAQTNARITTLKKKRRHLSCLMRIARPDKHFMLQAIRTSDEVLRKHVLSTEELDELVTEAKKRKRIDIAVLIRILYTFALRINSVCSLKAKDVQSSTISIFDSKVSKTYEINLDPGLFQQLKNVVKSRGDDNCFVFFPNYKGKNRSISCTAEFNKYLKTTSVFSRNYGKASKTQDGEENKPTLPSEGKEIKFSTHIFRVTHAHDVFNDDDTKKMEKVKTALGHSTSKTSRNYIYRSNKLEKLH